MPHMKSDGFEHNFEELTGHRPFPWQRSLYDRFVCGKFPPCSLPTGLGKTSVIAVWLLSLAGMAGVGGPGGRVPRRLVYVVNRRTIVDQATREAEKLRERLQKKTALQRVSGGLHALRGEGAAGPPLAISTLRGQFADNSEWTADPSRPAIVVGTVDMIGSRLLFSGYGRGFKSRPLHAGFLGQDALLVHDEAHLEPAFQRLLDEIRKEQACGRCRDFRPLRIMPLTATPRTADGEQAFGLQQEDFDHAVIKQRLEARKTIKLHPLDDEESAANRIAALATKRAETSRGSAILVFVRTVDDLKAVVEAIGKSSGIDKAGQVGQLTGTLRGLERDALVKTPVFQRFLSPSNRVQEVSPAEGTVFLVCTSAGEVGVDISADHLVCDLTTFDSMAQRFGRVHRYGDPIEHNAFIDIVHPQNFNTSPADKEYQLSREKTLGLLKTLNGDGSPKAIGELPPDERAAAFSPEPRILPATDILFDAWALTSIRDRLPGRPPVADWLHGVPSEWQPPQTQVAWREEVQWITGYLLEEYPPEDLLEVYPLKPHELLKDRSRRIFAELKKMARRLAASTDASGEHTGVPVWLEDDRGVEATTLDELIGRGEEAIADRTVILPPSAGGLSGGMLDGKHASADDVADQWFDEDGNQRRARVWDDRAPPRGMRPVRSAIDLDPGAEDAEDTPTDEVRGSHEDPPDQLPVKTPTRPGRVWKWYAKPRTADDDGSRAADRSVELLPHSRDVANHAARIVGALGLTQTPEGRALVFAAEAHDLGKDRGVWQRSIGNTNYPQQVLAKSGRRRPPRDLSRYRHEFGSLLDVLYPQAGDGDLAKRWNELGELERDLALHFIAAHHGRARPHFLPDEVSDVERPSSQATAVAREVPRRFARLQRQYGRWGLAYLESILRAADAAASAEPSEAVTGDAE